MIQQSLQLCWSLSSDESSQNERRIRGY